ncbi:MAG: HPr kinase/phosphatase C-terminal domain-containing protein [Rhodobacter sp.]|nr:HPr kinase/phosphatase C-terminal domain-containing protein [Rhodobacter sp.]
MAETLRLHASCAALNGRAVLITGPAGSGKSSLTLQLMAYGATLVSDDQTLVGLQQGRPSASAPDPLRGLIEARGVGILNATPADPTPIHLVIDMGHIEAERLPPDRHTDLLGQRLPLLHKSDTCGFAAAILQYLKAGKVTV